MGDVGGLEVELRELIALVESSPEPSVPSFSYAEPNTPSGPRPARSEASARIRPGTPWQGARGSIRWRLSPGARTLTRLSDGADLKHVVGDVAARATVAAFLSIRPSGGRIFVDDQGDAVTPVEGQLVYLGRLGADAPGSGSTPSSSSTLGGLGGQIAALLRAAPGSTAREIAYELGRSGTPVAKSEVNSVLYGEMEAFQHDGGLTPRWRVKADASAVSPSDGPARELHKKREYKRGATDAAYKDLVASTPPGPVITRTRAAGGARPLPSQVLDLMTWQQEAIASWYANGCHGIVEAVTGTGKTHLGLEAVAQATRDGVRSTVLVPSVDLQDQWADRFATFLPRVRVARLGGHKSGDANSADVTIAVVNSALRRDLSALSGDSLLVADEVHRYGAEQFQYALRANYKRRLGLTATLERSGDDAVEAVLSPYFGGSIMQVTFDRAIREGVVAPFRLVLAPVGLSDEEQAEYDDLSRKISNGMKVLRTSGALRGGGGNISMELGRLRGAGGDIGRAARMAEGAMRQRRQLLASVSGKLDAIEELAEMIDASQGAVIFTQSKGVAEDAARVLREWDVLASALHSDMNDRERRESLDDLSSGALQALAAPKLLDEGIDVPTVDLGIVMTASRSRRQMVQRLGRVIRRKDDGRPVDFVILYAHDTVEDPSSGVHEGFFDLVGEVASRTLTLEPGWTAGDLDN